LLKILSTTHLIEIPFAKFDQILNQCMEIFSLWDEEYEKFQGLLRDMTKKNAVSAQQLKQTWKITPEHKKLQARLEHLRQFRRQHEQFRSVIERLLSKHQQQQQQMVDPSVSTVQIVDQSDSNAVQEIQDAFESLKHINILECSPEGTQFWNDTIKIYEERIEKVERRITTRLREQLGKARNANEMFQIFARFHDLLIRQHIRNAIREYQAQLIQRVKIDIDQLHEKFKAKYSASKAMKMSRITVDIPVTTGSIIWAKQIEKQLFRYLKRVEDVLGSGWEQHVDGQRLKFEGDSFKQRLNTGPIFEDWLEKV
jgi:dynein heavy chain 1